MPLCGAGGNCVATDRLLVSEALHSLARGAGERIVRACGALLSPPQARCLLNDDFGNRWWPKDKPMPDLIAIQRANDAVDLGAGI
jgi:hypothetical protein